MARTIHWRKVPCPICRDRITSNSLGKAAHIRSCAVSYPREEFLRHAHAEIARRGIKGPLDRGDRMALLLDRAAGLTAAEAGAARAMHIIANT